MTGLIQFMNARLAEDEAEARDLIESEAAAAEWSEPSSGVLLTGPPTYGDSWDGTHAIGDSRITRFIARHDPARVLREVAAKRARLTLMIEAIEEMDKLLADDDAEKIDQGVGYRPGQGGYRRGETRRGNLERPS